MYEREREKERERETVVLDGDGVSMPLMAWNTIHVSKKFPHKILPILPTMSRDWGGGGQKEWLYGI